MVIVFKSLFFSFLAVIAMFLARIFLHTDVYLSDLGGLSAFLTVFGTLYGIMTAFVMFEVWNQYNKTSYLVDQEALGLERLFRLTLYFRDKKLTEVMKSSIKTYADNVIHNNFKSLASGKRNKQSSLAFRKISEVIKDIRFNDDHDQVVFSQIIDQYGRVSETRTERITQSLARLPSLLKFFLNASSFIALFVFILVPFLNVMYGLLTIGCLAFILAMVYQLVQDLDNPFVGNWVITSEPFARALKHIEEDYS